MNAKSQTAAATPKQGDHVFNPVETPIIRPFETIRSLRSTFVDGEHFIHDYLLHSYSMAKQLAETPTLIAARKYVAAAGAEDDALRELTRMSSRYPGLVRIDSPLLRDIHLGNSEKFGDAARRFDFEFLSALQRSLETAVSPQGITSAQIGPTPSPKSCIDKCLTPRMIQPPHLSSSPTACHAKTHLFKAYFTRLFSESRKRSTVPGSDTMITEIRDALTRMDFIKAPGVTFTQ